MEHTSKESNGDSYLELDNESRHNLQELIQRWKTFRIIPFVGSGLSQPFGYKGWTSFLLDEAQQGDVFDDVQRQLAEGMYEEAAEQVLQSVGHHAFKASLSREFGDHHLEGADLMKGAAAVLPYLPAGPILTTNFDHVIEHVFQTAERGFLPHQVIWKPQDAELANRELAQGSTVLVKLHGDVADPDHVILTWSQYESAYGPLDRQQTDESMPTLPLPRLLFRTIAGHVLLFLGCSLASDRPVDIVGRLALSFGGNVHYAIVETLTESQAHNDRRSRLASLGIRPIWYPNGRHDYVEKILNHILDQLGGIGPGLEIVPARDEGLLSLDPYFVNRAVERKSLSDRLTIWGRHGITVLGGPPGIGKSAMASQVIHEVFNSHNSLFPGGLAVVNCAELDTPNDVIQRLLARFIVRRLRPQPADPAQLGILVRNLLQNTEALVLLDNVKAEIEPLIDMLTGCQLTILITPRHTSEKYPETIPALDGLEQADAIKLFAWHYTGTPDEVVVLDNDDSDAIGRIVAGVGGHPLAIQLLATRARRSHLDLTRLAAEVERSPTLTGLAGLSQLMQQHIESLPGQAEKRLFAALAAFGDAEFSRAAVEHLCRDLNLGQPDAVLRILLDWHVIGAKLDKGLPASVSEAKYDSGSIGGPTPRERVYLSPLFRTVALEMLGKSPYSDLCTPACTSLAHYYANYVAQNSRSYRPRVGTRTLIGADERNILSALTWAIKMVDERNALIETSIMILLLCYGMRNFWRERWRINDSLEYLPRGTAAYTSLPVAVQKDIQNQIGDTLIHTRLLLNHAQTLRRSGDLTQARPIIEATVRTRHAARQWHEEGIALSLLGQIEQQLGRLNRADDYFRRALNAHHAVPFDANDETKRRLWREEGVVHNWLGQTALQRGDLTTANMQFELALSIGSNEARLPEQAIDLWVQGIAHLGLGRVALRRGLLVDAENHLGLALEAHRHVGDAQVQGENHLAIGQLALLKGRLDEAEGYFRLARALFNSVRAVAGEASATGAFGRCAFIRGYNKAAKHAYEQSLQRHRQVGDRREQVIDLINLAELAAWSGTSHDSVAAQAWCREAIKLAEEVNDPVAQATAYGVLAYALARQADQERSARRARRMYQKSVVCHQTCLRLLHLVSAPDEAAALRAYSGFLRTCGARLTWSGVHVSADAEELQRQANTLYRMMGLL